MAGVAFNWAEYLRLANELSRNSDEASHQTSISRAYYFVYHAASAQATRNGYRSNTHSTLWKVFAKDPDRDCKKLAQMGYTMKHAREEADYKSIFHRVPDRMAQQLTDAADFMKRLAALPPNVPQP
jgi:uncharacterized protein (UPF0332 family)